MASDEDPYFSRSESKIKFRTRLPDFSGLHFIFFPHLNQCFTVKDETGRVFFKYGHRNRDGSCQFIGWQPQIIEVNEHLSQQIIEFEVEAPYPFVGFKEFPHFGSYDGILLAILKSDIRNIAITIFYGVFSIIILTISFVLKDQRSARNLSLVVFNIGIYFFGQTKIKFFLLPIDEYWVYLEYGSLALIPLTFLSFMASAGRGELSKISYWFRTIFIIGFAPYFFAGFFDTRHYVNCLIYFQVMLLISILLYAAVIYARRAYRTERTLVLANFCLISTSAVGLIGNIANIAFFAYVFALGMVIFLLFLVYKVARDYHGNITTITHLKVKEENRRNYLFSERLAIINKLASGLAHEINNPLFIISGRLGILEKRLGKELSGDHSQHLLSIKSAINRISTIISQLLRFEEEEMRGQLTKIQLAPLLDKVIESCNTQIEEKNIDVTIDIGAKVALRGNYNYLFHAILAIFENSVFYSSQQRSPYIALRAEEKHDKILLSIENNGPEIPKEIQEKISDPFFSTSFSNRGLGLSVATNILRNMGGNLYLRMSNRDRTCFVLEFPIIDLKSPNKKGLYAI